MSKVSKTPKKSQKSKPKAKKKVAPVQPFLLRKAEQYFLIPEPLVTALPPEEAFRLAFIASQEQQKQLLQDAYKGDHYIDNIKVVDGLERSLSKLEELYPSIRDQISRMDSKIGRC